MRPCHAPRSRIGAVGLIWTAGVALAALLAASMANAAPIGGHFELTQFGGYTVFDEDRNVLTGTPLKNGLYLGGRLGYHFDNWIGFEVAGGFTPAQEDAPTGANLDFLHVSGNAVIRPLRAAWGWPYISVGGGASRLKLSGGGASDEQGNGEAAAGIQLWLNDAIGVRLEARDIVWLPKDDLGSPNSSDYVFGGGLTFAIGAKPRDTDGDGVPDRQDTCPNTTKGAHVDDKGCPVDSDGDGIADGLDQCPGTPAGAKVDPKGCTTDADGDSIPDGIDQCEGTLAGARVDAKGCPIDGDGDGVADGLDLCDATPKGCTVDTKGCPVDADGDSICDGLDRCPDTPKNLRVDAHGCPIEVSETETELLDTGMIRLDNIEFETGKADLLAEAKPRLDVVGNVLIKWPELKIEIGGHTDSRGAARTNQKLSEARAQSVLDYLLVRFPGLKSEQYVAKGYGASKPVVPNVSPEAMARNRRVEFVVLNKDVLRRESERRRLLEKDETTK